MPPAPHRPRPTSGAKPVPATPASGTSPRPIAARAMQFNLLGMMVVMLVASVMIAPAYYLVRGAQGQPGMQLIGIVVALTSPLLGMIILSVIVWIARRGRR